MTSLWDFLMFLLGSVSGFLIIGMIPRLLSGKICTRRKMYIILAVDALIFIVGNIASRTPITIIASLISLFILYLYFSKKLKEYQAAEEYTDCAGNTRKP